MFRVVRYDSVTGDFEDHNSYPEIAVAKSSLERLGSGDRDRYILIFDNDQFLTGDDEDKVIAEVLAANEGRVLRMSKNTHVSVSKVDPMAVCCGGPNTNCFCVQYPNGRRVCETTYCNANGYCWTVECSIPCGC